MEMTKYINKHVELKVLANNNTYDIKGKVVHATNNITKLATYKHRKITNRYIDNNKIVCVEDITIL